MEDRGAVLPGIPRRDPTVSYWQEIPDQIASLRTTEHLPNAADVVIIGSGISGCSVAFNLLQADPKLNVVLLEARQAASGASGRNGGHTKGASYRSFLDNVKTIGEEDAVKVARLEYNCMIAVHDFIREHQIACDARRLDTVDIFYDAEQLARAVQSYRLMEELLGQDDPAYQHRFYSPEETAVKFIIPDSLGAISYAAGSLDAYRFTIGVLKLALEMGLNLQTETPATAIRRASNGVNTGVWLVETPRGTIRTEKVVLATNGYTAHLHPKLQGVIVPFRGIVTAQRPGQSLPQTGLETTYSFIYDKGYEYMITRPKGSRHEDDVVIGGGLTQTKDDGLGEYGNTDDTALNDDIVHYLTDCTSTFFGHNWGADHPAGRVRHAWSGILAYSGDGHPLVGPIPNEEGLFIDASFQGHGMVLCFLCARAVTQMILGTDGHEELDLWFPRAYRMAEARYHAKFRGRLQVSKPVEHEVNGRRH